MKTCHEVAAQCRRRIPRPVKLAFATSFACGMTVYLFALTNLIIGTGDALNNTWFNGNLVWLGRWSSQWLCSLSTNDSMPLVNGLMMIAAVSLCAAMAAWLLDLKNTLSAVLCGVVMICYPSVGDTMKYLHNADGYMIGAALGMLAVLLTDRYAWGFAAGIALGAVAVGAYQANASLMIAFLFIRLVLSLCTGRLRGRALLLTALRYIALMIGTLALYYGLMLVFSKASGIALSDYQSVSGIGKMSLSTVWSNWKACYADFKQQIVFLSFRPDYYVNGYLNYLLVAVIWGCGWLRYLARDDKTWLSALALAACTALSPVMMCSIRMFNPDSVYSLMTYSAVSLYALGIGVADGGRLAPRQPRETRAQPATAASRRKAFFAWSHHTLSVFGGWVIAAGIVVCAFVWSVGENLDYYRSRMEYENMYAQCSQYLALAETAPGYSPSMPIYVIGAANRTGSSRAVPTLHSPTYLYAFMVYYLDVDMPFGIANAVDEAAALVAGTDAFRAMPIYPREGCAQVIDGAMIVKLSDGG